MKSIIINYKAYKEGIDKGLSIAMAANEAAEKTGVEIITAPQFTLLKEISKITKTIAQGVEGVEPGPFTAHITWYEIKKSGAAGTLINHSEKRFAHSKSGQLNYGALQKAIELCKQNLLETYVCVRNLQEAKKVTDMNPTAIAYEPPELIGGNVSVSTAKTEIVKEFCELVKSSSNSKPLIGAGIKTAEDVKSSVKLGSEGILVASGVIKTNNFKKAINELVKPLA